jgi:hypothetical protein
MLGPMGLGHPAVDGFGCVDDWYAGIARVLQGDLSRGGGPTEVEHFVKGTGIAQNSTAMLELMRGWAETSWAASAAVTKAGGFMHSNLNCMLDVDAYWNATFDGDDDDELPGSSLVQCGLHKTNGRPRANNTATAAVWAAHQDGVPAGPLQWTPWQNGSANGQCVEFLRTACDPSSVFSKIPTFLAFNGSAHRGAAAYNRWSSLYSDVARFLLVRGPFSWLGFGWENCVNIPPPLEHFAGYEFGEPMELCHESSEGSGVFTRRWSRANVTVDCNRDGGAEIFVSGHGKIPPVPTPPPSPPAAPSPRCRGGQCRECANTNAPCPFPVPPLPSCPSGYTNHSSGFWSDADPQIAGITVADCGARCTAAGKGCLGFEVYDPFSITKPEGGYCYAFSHGLKLPFTPDKRGLIRTCVREGV